MIVITISITDSSWQLQCQRKNTIKTTKYQPVEGNFNNTQLKISIIGK